MLTHENFKDGYLINERLMASVTEDPNVSGNFVAYVLDHEEGEYLAHESFSSLEQALQYLNSLKQDWAFEAPSKCESCVGTKVCEKKSCLKKVKPGFSCGPVEFNP